MYFLEEFSALSLPVIGFRVMPTISLQSEVTTKLLIFRKLKERRKAEQNERVRQKNLVKDAEREKSRRAQKSASNKLNVEGS